jgi:hypothetical protein
MYPGGYGGKDAEYDTSWKAFTQNPGPDLTDLDIKDALRLGLTTKQVYQRWMDRRNWRKQNKAQGGRIGFQEGLTPREAFEKRALEQQEKFNQPQEGYRKEAGVAEGISPAESAWAELDEITRTGKIPPDEPGTVTDLNLNKKLDEQGVNRFELEQSIQNDFDSKFADGEIKGFYEMERAKYRMKRLQEAVEGRWIRSNRWTREGR